MYKALATAVLLAATAFPLPLQGQMRAMHHPSGPARITVGSPFRSTQPHSNGFGVTRSSPFVRRSAFVRSFGSRHHHRFPIFFGNACFSDPFSDPFFCRQFFFRFLTPFSAGSSFSAPASSSRSHCSCRIRCTRHPRTTKLLNKLRQLHRTKTPIWPARSTA